MNAVEIKGLKKNYGNFQALKGIDLEVREGEIFALLGPNGAGKSTLMRILAEGLSYDFGEIKVFGKPLRKETARFIGYAPQESIAYELLTVEENLRFYADLYDAPSSEIPELIQEFSLPPGKLAKELSGGTIRRLNLAVALLYDPRILILDEPSAGLDVPSRRELWEVIRGFKARGKTVLIATHYMEEAEALADRVAIMNEGKVIAVGTPNELKSKVGRKNVIHIEGSLRGTGELKNKYVFIEKGNLVRITVENPRDALQGILAVLLKNGSEIRLIRVEEPTLEDVFLRLTGRGLV